jgi:hypothetical protein
MMKLCRHASYRSGMGTRLDGAKREHRSTVGKLYHFNSRTNTQEMPIAEKRLDQVAEY